MFIEKLKSKVCSKYILVALLAVLSGCSNGSMKEEEKTALPVKTVSMENTDNNPEWINTLISDLNSKPVKDSPESILQYKYQGKIVYYFSPACCGKLSNLYDQEKKIICKPDGGEDGKGDGKCPGFISERREGKLIWEENRD